MRIRLFPALLALLLAVEQSACRSASDPPSPDLQVPPEWNAGPHAAAEPPELWWREFGDPILDSLVERAIEANIDVRVADLRVREARAMRDFIDGALWPQVDARASYTRSELSANSRAGAFQGAEPVDLYDVGFDALWEVDLFGRNRSASRAAEAGLQAVEEDRHDVLLTLLGEVARGYVELRGLQRQITLTRENAASEQGTLELTRSRFEAGLATELDVARAQNLVSTTEARIPLLEREATGTIHRLSVLLGRPPASLQPELAVAMPVPIAGQALADLAAGVPSDLLRRRPDIRRAERQLAESAALTDAATAELYPRLTLGASIGLSSIEAADLFETASRTWSIGADLLGPIFDGGRRRANVKVQEARRDQAVEFYRRTVLEALLEVEDALVTLAREGERRAFLQTALDASRRATDLANDLHLRGLVDFFEVLDAQRSQLSAEAQLAQSETALTSQTVALYKALGGGWETLGE